MRTRGLSLAVGLLVAFVLGGPGLALAQDEDEVLVEEPPTEEDLELYAKLSRPREGFGRVLVHSHFGRGLRFNNPFRLEQQLGETEQSVSATAVYHDVGIGFAIGDPDVVQHGGSLRLSLALDGVPQQAFSLSYLVTYAPHPMALTYARVGMSVLTEPDANLGGELGLGGVFMFTGAFGVNAEVVGNLFYGAASFESELSPIPILSFQGGLLFNYEVLP